MNEFTEKLIEETRALQAEAAVRVKRMMDRGNFTAEQVFPFHALAKEYLTAREEKNYEVSDALREELSNRGVVIELLTREIYETKGLCVSIFRESEQYRLARIPKDEKEW